MADIQSDFCSVCGDTFVPYAKNGPNSVCNYVMRPRYSIFVLIFIILYNYNNIILIKIRPKTLKLLNKFDLLSNKDRIQRRNFMIMPLHYGQVLCMRKDCLYTMFTRN